MRIIAQIALVPWLHLSAQHAPAQTAGVDAAPLSAFARAKAEILLRDQLPCLGCHTLHGDGGRIGPELSTVAARRSAEYIAAVIADPVRVVPSTVMPRTRMPDETRFLITRYLAAGAAGVNASIPVITPTPADSNGPALYARYCASCHGASGRGDGPNAKYLPVRPAAHASRDAMTQRPDDSLYDTIAGGGAIMNRSPRMPAFGATLAPSQIRALVQYIRTLCGCRGPQWSLDGQ
jgi:mono/diheme cytochrome c family protein